MAISYVGGQSVPITVLTPTTQTIAFSLAGGSDSTPQAGDFVLITYGEGASVDATLSGRISTSGYTLNTELYVNDNADANLAVFYKIMGSTPDTSVVVVGNTASSGKAIVNINVFRGVHPSTPLDATTTTSTAVNTAVANPPAITPTTTGNVIVAVASSAISTFAVTYTIASTSYLTDFRQNNSPNTFGIVVGSGFVTGQAAGVSYDPTSWAVSGDNAAFSSARATLALRPAPPVIDASTSLSASGSLTTAGARARNSSSSFSGVGTFFAAAFKNKQTNTILQATSSVAALGARSRGVSTLFLGVGSLDALAGLLVASTASLGGSSSLTGTSFKTKTASSALNGSGSLTTLVLKTKSANFTGFNSEATRTTNLGDVRVTEDGNIRVTFPLVYNEAEATLTASSEKTQFNALAYVKQNGVWKRMVPNVKHSNIWQEAHRMYKKISDNWKRIY